MKKLGMHIIGALLLSSIPMHTAFALKKRKSYECQSDKKISTVKNKNKFSSVPEYTALASDMAGTSARLVAKRNYIVSGEVRTETLENGIVHFENVGNYLTIQGIEWALAIAPEKKRASLYSSNPDLNEIPMFCLSQGKI